MKEDSRTDVGFSISPSTQQRATGHQSVVEHFANQVQNDVARGGGCRLARVHGGQMVSPNYVGFNVWGLGEG